MTGMREHIQHRQALNLISSLQQGFAVSRQRPRVAGNIHHPPRRPFYNMRHHARRAGAGRVQQHFIKAVLRPGLAGDILFQIFMEEGDIG